MKSVIFKYIYLPVAMLLPALSMLSSCMWEIETDVPHPSGVETIFNVYVTDKVQSATRAITEGGADDNDVRDITVLLFNPASLMYERSVRTTAIASVDGTGNENRRTFKMNIPVGSYKALFLANTAAMIDNRYDLTAGIVNADGKPMTELSMDDVEEALKRQITDKYNAKPGTTAYKPFVMSSDREDLTIPGTTNYSANPIRLCRDVAKINVKFKSRTVSAQLTISEIRLCNYNTESYAVPARGWWSSREPLFAAAGVATRPAGSVVTGHTGIAYTGSDIDDNECVDEIFTPEQPAGSDNLCVLIRGDVTLDGTQIADRWYKIELMADDDGTLKPVNILRNYAYVITISGIGNPGYGSAQEAYEHAAEGIVIEITATPEAGMNDIVYNGEYQLAVDNSTLTLAVDANSTVPLRVFTDYSGGWQVAGIDYADGNTGWLTVTPSGTVAANTLGTSSAVTVTTTTVNYGAASRQAIITLVAGNLSKTITVTQSATPPPPAATITITEQVILSNVTHNPAVQYLTVTCTDSNGQPVPDAAWALSIPSTCDWLTISDTRSNTGTTVTGSGSENIYLFVAPNTGSSVREAVLELVYAGGTDQATVQQRNDNPPTEAVNARNSCVGAFWRWDQTGERIIQINMGANTGRWTAMVSFYGAGWNPKNGDGILLATSGSSANLDDGSDAEDYQMTEYGYTGVINGEVTRQDQSITFRIGLEKKFTAYNNVNPNYVNTFPARYAVVELWYAGNTKVQKLYLRQGEGDDYLMSANAPDNRPYARRFSPFNLTADQFNVAVALNGMGTNPGIPTPYPSQGGAYFHWVGNTSGPYNNDRVAYHPSMANFSAAVWWTGQNNVWSDSDESCPDGYRRPDDNTTNPALSEMRQSLFENVIEDAPQAFTAIPGQFKFARNSVFGYYADGFFDRRSVDNNGGASTGIVARGTGEAAYGGRLFYNPTTNASLFFPVTGYRNTIYPNNGKLVDEAVQSYYWTKTRNGNDKSKNAISLGLYNEGFGTVFGASISMGGKVRCIRDQ